MGNKVLITGVCGTVGFELAKFYINKGFEVFGIDINENEMIILEKSVKNDKLKLFPLDIYSDYTFGLLDKIKPDMVIHSAVLKNTRYNEIYKDYYHSVNFVGTIKFIYKVLSSDYVKRFIFLSSDEAFNPVNSFGKDKLEVEKIIGNINVNDKIIQAVRFPFILESKGSVFHIFHNQAKNNIPLTVTHKKIKKIATNMKCFMNTWKNFDEFILDNGLYNFNIGIEVSIYDLAVKIIKDMNSDSNIVISGLRKGEILNRKIIDIDSMKVYDNIFKLN